MCVCVCVTKREEYTRLHQTRVTNLIRNVFFLDPKSSFKKSLMLREVYDATWCWNGISMFMCIHHTRFPDSCSIDCTYMYESLCCIAVRTFRFTGFLLWVAVIVRSQCQNVSAQMMAKLQPKLNAAHPISVRRPKIRCPAGLFLLPPVLVSELASEGALGRLLCQVRGVIRAAIFLPIYE